MIRDVPESCTKMWLIAPFLVIATAFGNPEGLLLNYHEQCVVFSFCILSFFRKRKLTVWKPVLL